MVKTNEKTLIKRGTARRPRGVVPDVSGGSYRRFQSVGSVLVCPSSAEIRISVRAASHPHAPAAAFLLAETQQHNAQSPRGVQQARSPAATGLYFRRICNTGVTGVPKPLQKCNKEIRISVS